MKATRGRSTTLLALAVPVVAGLAYLAAFGAPSSYLMVNGGALVVTILWMVFAPPAPATVLRRVIIGVALLLMFLPLATGPALNGIARWLPLGPVTLHAGMLVLPALVVLAADEPDYAPAILSAALLAAVLQPDMATCAALTLAAFGFYDATQDWRHGVFAAVAFAATLVASINGELPAQPFADHIVFRLVFTAPLTALGLVAALLVSFFLIAMAGPGAPAPRKGLAGCLLGFSFAGLVANYPSALIGYGASPILGFGLALGLLANGRGQSRFPNRRPSA